MPAATFHKTKTTRDEINEYFYSSHTIKACHTEKKMCTRDQVEKENITRNVGI